MAKGSKSLYDRAVCKITDWVKPSMHRVTEEFIADAVEQHAKDNPDYARIIAFEVRRRGDGAGLTQDIAEPLLWTSVKTGMALSIATATHMLENRSLKFIGYATALGTLLSNGIDVLRARPRFKAGLQGSLEMAKDRWRAIEETGNDPFSSPTGKSSHLRSVNGNTPPFATHAVPGTDTLGAIGSADPSASASDAARGSWAHRTTQQSAALSASLAP